MGRQKKPYKVIQRLAQERKEKLEELKEEEKQLGVKMHQHTFAWKVDSDRKKKKELKAMSARRFSKRLLSIGYHKDGEFRLSLVSTPKEKPAPIVRFPLYLFNGRY